MVVAEHLAEFEMVEGHIGEGLEHSQILQVTGPPLDSASVTLTSASGVDAD